MKKILIVMMSLYNGGAEKSLVNMLNALPPEKYSIDLMLFKKQGMFLSQVPSWVNIIDAPRELTKLYSPTLKSGNMMLCKVFGTAISRLKESIPNMREGYRWEKFYSKKVKPYSNKYDVAIAYTSGEAMFFVGDKVQADRKIAWIHNDFRSAKHPKKYDYKYFKEMELVTISEECAHIVEEEFFDLNKHVHNIPNITSSSVIRARANEFVPSEFVGDKIKILSIGRLSEQKGFDLAIRAAEKMKQRNVSFEWYIIGDGNLKNSLQTMINERGLDDQFFLLGARENPYTYIKNCDIFAQTSRYEGKSVVLDEAKILGAPILVTRYPTVADQIDEGKEGLIVEIDPDSIADGIEKLIKDSALRHGYSEYLLSREYGNEEEIKKYIELFGE